MTTNKNLKKVTRTDMHGVAMKEMSQYNQALFNVLDNCRDLVEYAENKRSALWLFASVLQSLSWTVWWYDRSVETGLEITSDKNSHNYMVTVYDGNGEKTKMPVYDYWTQKLLDIEYKFKATVDMWQSFGEIYERQVIDYTSDNLDSLTQNLPTLDEMIKKHQAGKVFKQEVEETQKKAALQDIAQRMKR